MAFLDGEFHGSLLDPLDGEFHGSLQVDAENARMRLFRISHGEFHG
jgi:hypothetical protein